MMTKKLLLLVLLLTAVNAGSLYAGGDGGPLLMMYNLDFTSINTYLSANSIPEISGPVYIWGGTGVS